MVAAYSWYPVHSTQSGLVHGSLVKYSSKPYYQLQGMHLTMATVNSWPFMGSEKLPPASQAEQTCPKYVNHTGFLVDIMNMLSQQMNFTYSIYNVCDGNFGSQLPNGSWTGILREVLEGRAHVGLGNIGYSVARKRAVDFSAVAITYAGAGILVKEGTSHSNMFGVYLQPFNKNVWFCTLSVIPVTALFLCITSKFRYRDSSTRTKNNQVFGKPRMLEQKHKLRPLRTQQLKQKKSTKSTTAEFVASGRKISLGWAPEETSRVEELDDPTFSFSSGVMTAATALLQQGEPPLTTLTSPPHPPHVYPTPPSRLPLTTLTSPPHHPHVSPSPPSRLPLTTLTSPPTTLTPLTPSTGQDPAPRTLATRQVFGMTWVLSLVLYASYTSNLVSYLTVTSSSTPISSLRQLVGSDLQFGTRVGSVYIENFKSSSSPDHVTAAARLSSLGADVLVASYDEGLARVRNGTYAFIADYP
ncbi:Ionotropic receptor 201, partial [Hyalella azteca]